MACAMFLWDYILTFEMEVDLVWKSKWNFMKGLYLFQRYLPFIEPIFLFHCQSDMFPIFLCSSFHRSNGSIFDGDWMSEIILLCWRFVKLIHPT